MAKVQIICGSTGAGKTTYARKLSALNKGHVFSIDEWMGNLYWMDAPTEGRLSWALERVQRCEKQIWLIALTLLQRGQHAILDLGFSKRVQRDRIRSLTEASGYSFELHYLDVPVGTRWTRVERRNIDRPETYHGEVSREIFDWMEDYFEPPFPDELIGSVIVN